MNFEMGEPKRKFGLDSRVAMAQSTKLKPFNSYIQLRERAKTGNQHEYSGPGVERRDSAVVGCEAPATLQNPEPIWS